MRVQHLLQDTWKPLVVLVGLAAGTYYEVVIQGPKTNYERLTQELNEIEDELSELDTLRTRNVCINESSAFRQHAATAEQALSRARTYGRSYRTIIARLSLQDGMDVRRDVYALEEPGIEAMRRMQSLIYITRTLDSMVGDTLRLPPEHNDTTLVQEYYDAIATCQLAAARKAREALEQLYANPPKEH